MKKLAFFDLEVDAKNNIREIGAVDSAGVEFAGSSVHKFLQVIMHADYLVGHNIFQHDLPLLQKFFGEPAFKAEGSIDTLYWSPLLFPAKPYHKLLKDDKFQQEEANNPRNDALKARDLFYDEVLAFHELPETLKRIYFNLLHPYKEFSSFFKFIRYNSPLAPQALEEEIRNYFKDSICEASGLNSLIGQSPVPLAYALAQVTVNDRYSIIPRWLLHQFPEVHQTLFSLRGKPCISGCNFCREALNPSTTLKAKFGFSEFRSYGGQNLQEKAVKAAIQNKSLLAVFPTGGGKSITFQIPALVAGEVMKALTVVISPLQSLMKDQVDNLERRGITDAVTINGLLDPIERSKAIERVADGTASILYISPESLRSITIERLLLGRTVARFVIDEAHCFSSWGQDFRVDYLYIGDFIKSLQAKKRLEMRIPVSCFTATAKPKVIEDICLYFKDKLGLDLEVFSANAARTNLHYKVFNQDNELEKYAELRRLLEAKPCPTIIYVSRTRKALEISESLQHDGFNSAAFHGKMTKEEKTKNQNDFIKGRTDIIVATSAFGMGVDKSDVGMVIHYDISDSLENYVQEAGRAGHDEKITADCYILFNESDLDKHFILLNQTRLDAREINQIWRAIKDLTRTRARVSYSALEIARKAGWDDGVSEIETRVKTAIAALEEAGYLARGQNMPRVYANSILSQTAQEAVEKINSSERFSTKQKEKAIRVIKKLFSSKSKRLSTDELAESRIDYISDHLGIVRQEIIQIIQLLREEKILADARDLTAFIRKGETGTRSLGLVEKYRQLEEFLLQSLNSDPSVFNLKEFNETAIEAGYKDSSPNRIRTIINFWAIKNWIRRRNSEYSRNHIHIRATAPIEELSEKMERRHSLARFIVEYLYQKADEIVSTDGSEEILVEFSIQELKEAFSKNQGLFRIEATNDDIEDSLFYLSRIEAVKIEGGFLVIYNSMTIKRLESNNRIQYKDADYEKLRTHYQNKVQQIHIVGEYAKKMVENYKDALDFVDDYFRLNYNSFLQKYFPGSRQDEIKRTLTPAKFQQLFGSLSPAQLEIIKDNSQYIVVAAGPGSGKTRVLVHKLASLFLTEDVKHEQLLMLTFSRSAATEFKKRLLELIGNAANFMEIKTFHSYCFDLIGRVGSLGHSESIIATAVDKINRDDIEPGRITKTVLVIDEAQDISAQEFNLIKALIRRNEGMRVILVGDDDQNIFEFRGSDAGYMRKIAELKVSKNFELLENYRSRENIVSVANQWASCIHQRLKQGNIIAVNKSSGRVKIVEYRSANFIMPAVQNIAEADLVGTTCVMTRTNDEAVQVAGILLKNGFTARLIQSNDGFRLSNLKELRFFTDMLTRQAENPIISNEDWEAAKKALKQIFSQSDKLEGCMNIIKDFELVNPVRKYISDWKSFLTESMLEDFVRISGDTIYVSTIHKAKGKEFDNVYLILDNLNTSREECKRQLYVAMSRAKTNLTIHYNGQYLRHLVAHELHYSTDINDYPSPKSISFKLTHRDVWLGYFDFVQHRMAGLFSGNSLTVLPEGLASAKGMVVKFSKEYESSLKEFYEKGYQLRTARVNFLLYWYDEKASKEVEIILPELELEA